MLPNDAVGAPHPGSKRFDIDRVDATIAPDLFVSRYYLPQVPVILTGVAGGWPAATRWSPEYLRAALEHSSIEKSYNFDVPADHSLVRDCEVPSVVTHVAATRPITTRAESLRVWISRLGTCTRWHYDGNSLMVANVQVRGRKRWWLISPDTPPPTLGFGQGASNGYADLSTMRAPVVHTVCEVGAGDLIFVPQHWYHAVVSLDRDNLNINWVWTDTELLMSSRTRTAVREREQIAALYAVGRRLRRLGAVPPFLEYVETYGGSSQFALARQMSKTVSRAAITRRLFIETARLLTDGRHRRANRERELELNDGVRRSAYDYFRRPARGDAAQEPQR